MQKIQSLFKRNYEGNRRVYSEVIPGSEWVINGQGIATRKWDGTSCMIQGGQLFKRYDAKNGKKPPEGFIPAQEPDPITGHWPGWVLVTPNDKWHQEALKHCIEGGYTLQDGTYELLGPKINNNPERIATHSFINHKYKQYESVPRHFEGIKEWLFDHDIEGIVWHHPDGRMVKIKKKDFGFKR